MYITKIDVEKVLSLINDFDGARSFRLQSDSSSGIGTIMSLIVETDVCNHPAEVKIVVSDVECW